jgi:TonB family protein
VKRSKTFLWVSGIHLLVLGGLLVATVIKNWIKPNKPVELVTTVMLGSPMPLPPSEVFEEKKVDRAPQPPKPPPEHKTENVEPKKPVIVKRSDTIVEATEPPPPRKPTPKKPTAEDLRKKAQKIEDMLKDTVRLDQPDTTNRTPVNTPAAASEIDAFYSKIHGMINRQWDQPDGITAASGYVAIITIRISKTGAISGHRISERSGHAGLDLSALTAAKSVKHVSGVPRGFTAREVKLEFKISR